MSYEFYKILHVGSVFLLLACSSASFMGESKKMLKILGGIASLLILVAGMGLLARIGVGHGEAFPTWVFVKMFIWVVLAVGGPIAVKRVNKGKELIWGAVICLAIVSAAMAILKP